eukprot:jgi/Chlat1/6103/Chrsp40S05681
MEAAAVECPACSCTVSELVRAGITVHILIAVAGVTLLQMAQAAVRNALAAKNHRKAPISQYSQCLMWILQAAHVVSANAASVMSWIATRAVETRTIYRQADVIRDLECKLREAELDLLRFAEAMPGGMYKARVDATGKVNLLFVSAGALEHTGHTPESLERGDHFHPDDKAEFYRQLEECGKTLKPLDFKHRDLRPNGEVVWVRCRTIAQPKDASGAQIWHGVDVDYTEMQKTQEALQVSEERMSLAVSGSTDGMWDIDMVNGKDYRSKRYLELLGFAVGETWETTDQIFDLDGVPIDLNNSYGIHPEDAPRVEEALRDHLEQGAEYDCEFRLKHKSGVYKWFRGRGSAIRDQDGKPIRMSGTVTDVTDRKQAEEALRVALEAATRAAGAKAQFLANMSHELRTPLNAILGYAYCLLETQPLAEEQRMYATIIRSSSDQLLTLVNDILDFSKIEAGKLMLEKSVFDVVGCVEDSLDLVATQAADKGLDLAYRVEPDVPASLCGDVSRLRQILVNLVSNAVKFTSEGAVVVEVEVDHEQLALEAATKQHASSSTPAAPELVLKFSVRDTGIGVPLEFQHVLFTAFSQVDTSTTRRFAGTGLGLAICAKLATLMGGRVWIESNPEEKPGATFSFNVKLEVGPAKEGDVRRPSADQTHIACFAGCHVLLLTAPASERVASSLLERWGCHPLHASSVDHALDMLQNRRPAACILDAQVVTPQDIAKVGAACKLIVLTPQGGVRQEAINTEAEHLFKPLRSSQLFNALQQCVLSGKPNSPRVHTRQASIPVFDETMASRYPLRILVAEDNVINQQVLRRMLSRLGYQSDICANGLEAIAATQQQRYDVILMDNHMPLCDGPEATQAIRQEGNLPVIVAVTAAAMRDEIDACLAAGMDFYVCKPVEPRTLISALTRSHELACRRLTPAGAG